MLFLWDAVCVILEFEKIRQANSTVRTSIAVIAEEIGSSGSSFWESEFVISVVTNPGISLPGISKTARNCPGMGKNTIPGLFLEIAFVGLK